MRWASIAVVVMLPLLAGPLHAKGGGGGGHGGGGHASGHASSAHPSSAHGEASHPTPHVPFVAAGHSTGSSSAQPAGAATPDDEKRDYGNGVGMGIFMAGVLALVALVAWIIG